MLTPLDVENNKHKQGGLSRRDFYHDKDTIFKIFKQPNYHTADFSVQ